MTHRNPYQHASDRWVVEQFQQADENPREPRAVIASLMAILLCISSIAVSAIISVAIVCQLLSLPVCLPYFVMTVGFICRARLTSPSRSTAWIWLTSALIHAILFGLSLYGLWSQWEVYRDFMVVILGWSLIIVLASIQGHRMDRSILRDRVSNEVHALGSG